MQVRGTLCFGVIILVSAFLSNTSIQAHAESGIASTYSGERTANGEYAHASGFTAAHRSLPFGTFVEVTNTATHRSVIVRINDRGPFVAGRVIDLTPAGAKAIGFSGLARVTLTVLGRIAAHGGGGHKG